MKSKIFIILALSSVSMLSADSYGRSSCPGGNCPYQGQNQGQRQGYYPEASGQAYYRDNPQYYRQSPSNQYDQNQQNRSGNQYNSNQNNQDGYYNPSNTNTSNSNRNVTDEDLRKKVDNAIAPSWLSSGYPNVNYNVNNGTVDLRGTVKSQDDKAKLEADIKKIDGVRQVNNQIMVNADRSNDSNMRDDSNMRNDSRYDSRNDSNMRNDSRNDSNMMRNDSEMRKAQANYPQDNAASDTDRSINARIRDRLSGWFTNGYETITLNTSNGVVTIIGFVKSNDDIEKINKEAKNVDGVKSVNNNASIQR